MMNDLRHALRRLRASPGWTAVAALTLALGIGANTAMFGLADAVLLRPPPFARPDRLLSIGAGGASYVEMKAWREQSRALQDVGLYSTGLWDFDLTGGDRPERIAGSGVSAGFFHLLGVEPAMGRAFEAADEAAEGARPIVVSHGFWQRRLAADPAAAGRHLVLNGLPYVVIGVMPRDFGFPDPRVEVWSLLTVEIPAARDAPGLHAFAGLGRLNPGATLEQVRAEIAAAGQGLARLYPEEETGREWAVRPLSEELTSGVRSTLLLLLAAVALVLLVACANVAGLLLARGLERRGEIAIRTALGAGRGRLIRQLVTESVLLSLLGGALGLVMAVWAGGALASLAPPGAPSPALDGRLLSFAFGLAVLTGAAFGAFPAVQLTGGSRRALLAGGARAVGERSSSRLRSILVAAEVALSFTLLVGACLLLRSLWNLDHVDPGFHTERVLTFRIALPESRYADVPPQAAFFDRVLEGVRSLPGVRSAGAVGDLPVAEDMYAMHNLAIEGRPEPEGQEPEIAHRPVTPGYFETMGIPVLRGRAVTPTDREGSLRVAVVNRAMARHFWPGEDPLGKRIRWARQEGLDWLTIVGVVGDVRSQALDQPEEPAVYSAEAQSLFPWRRQMTLVVRAASEPLGLVRALEREVWAVDPDVPLTDVRTLGGVLSDSLAGPRRRTLVVALFAGLALGLAVLGLYGVLAAAVAQRTREIGLRIALGARAGQVVQLVVESGLRLTLVGVAAGLGGAAALTRLLRGFLYGVAPLDPVTFLAIPALLLAVALVASYVPARRASRVDAMAALRAE